jgi:hypothetical protein
MKSNAYLYLPWSVIEEWLGSLTDCRFTEATPRRFRVSVASVEQLDSGCELHRLAAQWRRNH